MQRKKKMICIVSSRCVNMLCFCFVWDHIDANAVVRGLLLSSPVNKFH